MSRVSLGLGLSSGATRSEVLDLACRTLARAGYDLWAVSVVSTREVFAGDRRVSLGPPIMSIDDATLVDKHPAIRTLGRVPRFDARVAEGCALEGAGPGAALVVATQRSPHATAAVAVASARVTPP